MKVNSILIERYLAMVTESRAAMLDDPAGDLTAYDDAIDAMGAAARAADDDDLLRMSIASLIASPGGGRLAEFAGSVYRWPNREFIPLLTRAHERLWPDFPLGDAEDAPDIDFVAMSSAEWAAYTGRV
ncbi:MAG: hypothetical protein ACT4OK_03340 [Gemmobacter sp.]